MANRYWVGGSGSWNTTSTTNWSATSGGTAGASAPTSADSVFFDANSNVGAGAFTVDLGLTGQNCLDLTISGLDGALTFNQTITTTNILTIYGSLTISSPVTWNGQGNGITFAATSTGKTINTGGNTLSLRYIDFNGVGGGWTLTGALTVTASPSYTGSISVTNGTFNTGSYNITCPGFTVGGGTATFGTSTVTISLQFLRTAGTISAASATFVMSGTTAKTFGGDGLTYGTLRQSGTGTLTITGANTFTTINNATQPSTVIFPSGTTTTVTNFNLSGTANNLITINSSSAGTRATIAGTSAVRSVSYVNIKDINATPSGGYWFAITSTNSGNNLNITFLSEDSRYWVGGTGTWDSSTTTKWAYVSNGITGAPVPTINNPVYIDGNSGSGTITYTTAPGCADLIFTGYTGTLAGSATINVYGHLYLSTGMTLTSFTGGFNLLTTSSGKKIFSAGKTIPGTYGIIIGGTGGYTLLDNLNTGTGNLTLNQGNLFTNGQSVLAANFNSTGSLKRILSLGSTTFSVTGGLGSTWNVGPTNLTVSAGTSQIRMDGSGEQTFAGAGFTYYELSNYRAGNLIVSGDNIFSRLTYKFANSGYKFTAGSTTAVSNFLLSGSSTGPTRMYIDTTGGTAYLSKIGTGRVSSDYLTIGNTTVSPASVWYAGVNSVDVTNNSGWVFTAPSLAGGLITDPDALGYEKALYTATTAKELVIDITNKLIKLTRVGNLTAEGTTLKALYSKLKIIWISDTALNPLPFPIEPITDEQYNLINGWDFDRSVNSTTKITVTGCTGTISTTEVTASPSFPSNRIFAGAFVSGGGVTANATVKTVNSSTSITLDTAHTSSFSSQTLTFWYPVDYTYNLICTAGFAKKSSVDNTTSEEEWFCAISLGNMGAEGALKNLTTTAVTTSTAISVNSVTGVTVGSYITGPSLPYGARVGSVDTTNKIITSTIAVTGNVAAGAIFTIRPKDQPYYQIGLSSTVPPINAILPGQVNQPIQIYGDATHGNFDYRSPQVASFYLRESAWTYAVTNASDVGVGAVTYIAYRFSLTNVSDALKITHSDQDISTIDDTNAPTASPYNNMRVYWYVTPQPRMIGGSTYYFNVIIDADITLQSQGPYAFGTASAEQIYEFVQWTLRRGVGVDIDEESATRVGKTTRQLVEFIGDNLYTIYDSSDGGVYIDHFRKADINRIVFSDNTNRQFPYVSFGTITFDTDMLADAADATFVLYYKQINDNVEIGAFEGNIANTNLTVSRTIYGNLQVGDSLVSSSGANVAAGIYVSGAVTGTGFAGLYTLSSSQATPIGTVSSPVEFYNYRGISRSWGSKYAVIVRAFSSDPSGDGSREIRGNLQSITSAGISFDYDWDSSDHGGWAPYNYYRVDDEYWYNNGTITYWYRVLTAYFSGATWSSILDGAPLYSEQIAGPSVVLVATGKDNAQYFHVEGTIAKSNTNSLNVVSDNEKNYSEYSAIFIGNIEGTTMTVSAVHKGIITTAVYIGGAGVTEGTVITAQTSGNTGSTGTYTVSANQSVPSGTTIIAGI